METGMLENILIRRYGQPIVTTNRGLRAHCWNPDEFDYSTILYIGMEWKEASVLRFASLKEIYGDALGGFLIKNILKVAVLSPQRVYGLWNINDLRMQPEVRHALERDPAIDFFMDAYNVYFYGIKSGQLYVFDAEMDELDCLGPIESALETVLDELVTSRQDVGDC